MSVYGSYPAIHVNSVWEEKLMLKWNINKKSSSVFFQWQTMVIICKGNIVYDINICVRHIAWQIFILNGF